MKKSAVAMPPVSVSYFVINCARRHHEYERLIPITLKSGDCNRNGATCKSAEGGTGAWVPPGRPAAVGPGARRTFGIA
jgi:hypothetical protein